MELKPLSHAALLGIAVLATPAQATVANFTNGGPELKPFAAAASRSVSAQAASAADTIAAFMALASASHAMAEPETSREASIEAEEFAL